MEVFLIVSHFYQQMIISSEAQFQISSVNSVEFLIRQFSKYHIALKRFLTSRKANDNKLFLRAHGRAFIVIVAKTSFTS